MNTIRSVVLAPGTGIVRARDAGGEVREIPMRVARDDDDVAVRLGRLLGVPARVHDGDALPAPGAGTVVLCRDDVLHRLVADRRGGCDWVVLLDAGRTRVLRQVEELGLAAAVERTPLEYWTTGRTSDGPAIFGLREVAAMLGAAVDDHPLTQGTRYARFRVPGAADVPTMLAAYLDAWSRWGA